MKQPRAAVQMATPTVTPELIALLTSILGATQGQAAGAVPLPSSQTTAIALGANATLVFGNGVTANVRQVGGNTTGSTVEVVCAAASEAGPAGLTSEAGKAAQVDLTCEAGAEVNEVDHTKFTLAPSSRRHSPTTRSLH